MALGILEFMRIAPLRKYALAVVLLVAFGSSVLARDDGHYANDPLKYWFDHLSSGNGMCCSFADGLSVNDVDWDMQNSHYRVLLHGEWIIVPDSAVVGGPNRYGPAVVWPYLGSDGKLNIRCFLPGANG
jgi:hypothetical protein